MQISRLMVVTQSSLMRPDFSSALQAALEGGARLIQLREKEIAASGVLQMAQTAKKICDEYGAQLLVNGNIEMARAVGAGTHLPESQSVATAREFLGREYSIGQSTHSVESARRAANEGADYIVFGSVFPTASHIGSTPAGIAALREVARTVEIPVFAIGGITLENAAQCLDAGAYGVAVIRAAWDAPDIAAATRRLVEIAAE